MILADCHTHSLCSPDSEAPMPAMAQRARELGLTTLCLTDHCDLLNGDGERTNLDVIYLARSLLGLVTLNDSQKSAADVNGDGNVSNADVIRLARVLIGLDQI